MVFELAGDGAFDRPVAGIVDARRHFVGQQTAVTFEQFDGQDSYVVERLEDAASGRFRFALQSFRQTRSGRQRKTQDSIAMVIFDQPIKGGFPIARAHREDRKLARKFHEFFEYQRSGRDFVFYALNIFACAENPLAFSVIAEAAGFQNGRETDLFNGLVEFARGMDDRKFSRGNAEFLKQKFFAATVLRGFQRLRRGIYGNKFLQEAQRFDGNVFKLVSDERQAVSKFFQRFEIRIFGSDTRRDAAYRSLRRWIEKTKMEIQRVSGEREHVAQLAAAENSDGQLRFPFLFLDKEARDLAGSRTARTFLVCEERNFLRASRIFGYLLPSEAAARSAALTAPALPIASGPTGMPPGIWAMERRESRPLSVLDSTGTPKTGTSVLEAVIPGKCAAPPAPAMMTSMPRFSASLA